MRRLPVGIIDEVIASVNVRISLSSFLIVMPLKVCFKCESMGDEVSSSATWSIAAMREDDVCFGSQVMDTVDMAVGRRLGWLFRILSCNCSGGIGKIG